MSISLEEKSELGREGVGEEEEEEEEESLAVIYLKINLIFDSGE